MIDIGVKIRPIAQAEIWCDSMRFDAIPGSDSIARAELGCDSMPRSSDAIRLLGQYSLAIRSGRPHLICDSRPDRI